MRLSTSVKFNPACDEYFFDQAIPTHPAVFSLALEDWANQNIPPYLGRTSDLRRRLKRLLRTSQSSSRLLNLREITREIQFQPVGSAFEAQWLLYLLNRFHYPQTYRQRLRLKPVTLLKVNLTNRFPRCYPTRRLKDDGSLYYGPFPNHLAAERFGAEFLDFFRIRRCVEELEPDPAHPGCIYSQMRMCLAPCFGGCTDDDYRSEVGEVVAFLDADGRPLLQRLETERSHASESLDFEAAGRIHRRIEKVHEVLRLRPELARNLLELHAVVVLPGAKPKSVVFFRLTAGELRGPAELSLDENVASPTPLDEQLQTLLVSLAPPGVQPAKLPPWEHLALVARWYYSSFRQGEISLLPPSQEIAHARLIRLCRKVLKQP